MVTTRSRTSFLIAILIVAIDQISKRVIVRYGEYTINYGAAFGILQHQRWLFIIIAIIVMIALVFHYIPKHHYPELGLLLGGITGNLIDRLVYGYVIDFIDIGFWPSFNVADSCNTVAVLFLIWRLEALPRMRKLYKDGKQRES